MLDLVIIGAGPYGISLASFAQAHGLSYRLLGYPMDFWKHKMPQNMFIRTPSDFVNLEDPNRLYTLKKFAQETGTMLHDPLPRTVFTQYAMWFVEKTKISITPQLAENLHRNHDHFVIDLENGESLHARNVIIAVGVDYFKYIPKLFEQLPESLITHTSGYTYFSMFKGQKVAVIGSGQSAWEAAALLAVEGANPELIYRAKHPIYSGGHFSEKILKSLGNVFYLLPVWLKKKFWGPSRGTIAHFLRPLVEGKVRERAGVHVKEAAADANGKVILHFNNDERHAYDHILSASGFRLDVDKLPFLSDDLKKGIAREEGASSFPSLSRYFESSISGLFFAGPLSSNSHGPTFRFILGIERTCRMIFKKLLRPHSS